MRHFYLLVHKDTKKTFVLKLPRKHFSFIVNDYYFSCEKADEEFTLEEKLCLLNHSENIAWKQISLVEVLFRTIFLNITTPLDFELFLNRNKVNILVNGKVQGKLIIK